MAADDMFVSPKVNSSPIPADVQTYDSDTSDTERESGIESTVTTLGYPLSSQHLEYLTIIYHVVSDFSSFSGCLKMYLLELVKGPTRHLICLIFTS